MRQDLTPNEFRQTTRIDSNALMTSGRAGVVTPLAFIPLLRGDSASGAFTVDLRLGAMPKPVLNAVVANLQAWFVPKSALPQFGSYDEFIASYSGEAIKSFPTGTRTPPPFFQTVEAGAGLTALLGSTVLTSVGLHAVTGKNLNVDYLDAFTTVYNFRLNAYSSKLPPRKYVHEDNPTTFAETVKLPRGFWPHTRMSRVVADYDRALIVGDLALDVLAGRIPISGINQTNNSLDNGSFGSGRIAYAKATTDSIEFHVDRGSGESSNWVKVMSFARKDGNPAGSELDIFAEFDNTPINVSLADLDRARRTQAFARRAAMYAGNNWSEQRLNDTVMADLMQGFRVPESVLRRPMLLDNKLIPVNMVERSATDGENLDQTITEGGVIASLSLNVPRTETGGIIVVTCEVGPERFYERQSDPYLHFEDADELPNALRDVQRTEPVDIVENHRIDAKHTAPNDVYGYEAMNDKWNRDTMRLGGIFYEPVPGAPWKEARSQIWLPDYVDPNYSADHFLYPEELSHAVFKYEEDPAFEAVVRHSVAIRGLTQIGDPLFEDNGEYDLIEGVSEDA